MVPLSLAGFTVGVTADRRWEEQAELLRRRGASVVVGPTIRTTPLSDDAGLRRAVDELVARPPAHTVLMTGVGVRGMVAATEAIGRDDALLAALRGSSVVARGSKAAGAALTIGMDVAWSAPGARSAEVIARLGDAARGGARIAVQRDGGARSPISDSLRELGADVVDIPVYRWLLPEDPTPATRLLQAGCEGRLDAVTFTSTPALENLFVLADTAGCRASLLQEFNTAVRVVCVGPATAEAARAAGVRRVIEPPRARLGVMIQALTAELAADVRALRVGSTEVVLQGAMALVDGQEVRLTDRERAVLHVLADAGGAVVTKRALLRDVWRDETEDEHAVEVLVGRLRRRLGPAGRGIETVPRRGYRLALIPAAVRPRPDAAAV